MPIGVGLYPQITLCMRQSPMHRLRADGQQAEKTSLGTRPTMRKACGALGRLSAKHDGNMRHDSEATQALRVVATAPLDV